MDPLASATGKRREETFPNSFEMQHIIASLPDSSSLGTGGANTVQDRLSIDKESSTKGYEHYSQQTMSQDVDTDTTAILHFGLWTLRLSALGSRLSALAFLSLAILLDLF
jgi:hypothetical protein